MSLREAAAAARAPPLPPGMPVLNLAGGARGAHILKFQSSKSAAACCGIRGRSRAASQACILLQYVLTCISKA